MLCLVLLVNTLCNCSNAEDEIIVDKIIVEKEYCENCIGLNKLKIKYITKTKSKIKGILVSNQDKLNFKVYNNEKEEFDTYLYEIVFDEISLSKFYTLNNVKRKFHSIIYFKKISFINSKKVMKTTNKTKVCYILNGTQITETDVRMNYPKSKKLSLPTRKSLRVVKKGISKETLQ